MLPKIELVFNFFSLCLSNWARNLIFNKFMVCYIHMFAVTLQMKKLNMFDIPRHKLIEYLITGPITKTQRKKIKNQFNFLGA